MYFTTHVETVGQFWLGGGVLARGRFDR